MSRFQTFVDDLVTVEKRQIVALTELAKDIVSSKPHLAPQVAQVVIDRALKVSAHVQLPVLYLLDSLSKNIGEPFITCFANDLPRVFSHAWIVGAPGLHKSLRKLAGTWEPVYPKSTMDAIEKSMIHAGTVSSQDSRKPMMRDPRLAGDVGTHEAPVGDILSLIANAGNLSQLLGVQIPTNSLKTGEVTTSLELKSESIKERNQAAINRLLNATRSNQSVFLDNKFLKKKVRDSKTDHSQMWYVDLDTWYKGTTAHGAHPNTEENNKRGPEDISQAPVMSVPVDESQTECAVSGEKFEKFWDDELQEWRYLDAMRVSGSLAKRLGVPAGSLVCASTVDISDRVAMGTNDTQMYLDAHEYDTKRVKLEHM